MPKHANRRARTRHGFDEKVLALVRLKAADRHDLVAIGPGREPFGLEERRVKGFGLDAVEGVR